MTKEFPQFQNDAVLEGVVTECDIELKEFTNNDGKYKALAGRIIIQTGENETQTAQYFVKELKKDGGENGIFTNVKTVLDDMVTLTDIAQGKAPEGAQPSKVRVRGELGLNEYFREGKLNSTPQVRGVFLNRVKDETQFEPKATYDVEAIVAGVSPEIKGDDETGRAIVKILLPTYNSALPFVLHTRAEDGEYILDNFEVGQTVNLYGNMVNFSKKIEVEKAGGFGQAKTEVKYENVRELLITGGDIYSEESPKTLDSDQIKELQTRRNVQLASLEEKANNPKTPEKKAGFGGNTPTTTGKKVDPAIAKNLF